MKESEKGVFEVPIIVSKDLKEKYKFIRASFYNAQKRIKRFCIKHGFDHLIYAPFIKNAYIYNSKKDF